jgi:hypothetical protein
MFRLLSRNISKHSHYINYNIQRSALQWITSLLNRPRLHSSFVFGSLSVLLPLLLLIHLLWRLLTSWHIEDRIYSKTSPGNGFILPPITAASTDEGC